MSEENKAVVRRYFEEFHYSREYGILEEIMVPDCSNQQGEPPT